VASATIWRIAAFALCITTEPWISQAQAATTLVYEVDRAALGKTFPADAKRAPHIKSLVCSINRRLGPTGNAELLDNGQLQVKVNGNLNADELASIKLRIGVQGSLEFRLLASLAHPEDQFIIEQARSLPPDKKEVVVGGNVVAEWATYSEKEFGLVDKDDKRLVKRLVGKEPEALVLVNARRIGGEYLASVKKGADEAGNPALDFTVNERGAELFRKLTATHQFDPANKVFRYLGVLLDERLLYAPAIRAELSNRGQISGQAVAEHEVDALLAIFEEGALPYTIREVRPVGQPNAR
jgi:preprotein translocase subunit SecD